VHLLRHPAATRPDFPAAFIAGLEDGLFPHSRSSEDDDQLEEERRLFYVGMTRARRKLILTSAGRRRVFGEYRASEPSRFLDEIPDHLMQRYDFVGYGSYGERAYGPSRGSWGSGGTVAARGSGGSGGSWGSRGTAAPPKARPAERTYAPEDEDQSQHATGLRLGMRVRHPQFGVGTVLGIEDHADDLKVTVRFAAVGVKRLLARFAKLEPA